MDFTVLLAALKAAVIAKLASIGAAFAAGFSTIAIGFAADERAIGAAVMAKFHESLDAAHKAGVSEVDAIEQAATAAYNEFCHDEVVEFRKEADAIITLLRSSFMSALANK
jgi:NADH:ubiquinone oxidoreductase subunit K